MQDNAMQYTINLYSAEAQKVSNALWVASRLVKSNDEVF